MILRNLTLLIFKEYKYYLKLMVLDKSLILSNLILSAGARVNRRSHNWSCLDLLNWRLCNYKCVSNTIWLNIDLFFTI